MAFYSQLGDASIEKCLEHYLTTKYLGLKKNDVIIDLGASSSPFTDILYKHGYTNTYKQDLLFKHGIHGNQIGGNAGNMSIPANFANVMTLHCAFECFQGNSDIETIQEAERVLKNGGRLGIIPLYLDSTYFIKTGYACDRSKIDFDNKAKIVFRDDRFIEEPFSRHYSPESFFERIIKNIKKSKFKIVYFTNLEEIRCAYPDQKIYCNFLFIMTKTK